MSVTKKYLGEFVYGAMDGTVTTFSIVAGSIGAAFSPAVILILGFVNLFADGFSMAASAYLSARSRNALDKDSEDDPFKDGLVTFFAFVIIGFVPLLSFVLASYFRFLEENAFFISIILTAAAFIFIGTVKGKVTEKNKLGAAAETFLVGALAAGIAYGAGLFLKSFIS